MNKLWLFQTLQFTTLSIHFQEIEFCDSVISISLLTMTVYLVWILCFPHNVSIKYWLY